MKTSVTSYSFGEYINPDRLGYLGIIDKAKEFGFDGIEYTEGYWMDDPDAPLKIKEHCKEVGIEPALFAVGADFINGSGGTEQVPHAGVKQSGVGCDKSPWSLEEYFDFKYCAMIP